MARRLDPVGEIGLQFFGKITASISHEIKNVLAIINENAGLLEDFTQMADRGMPIDPERLKTLSRSVMNQIRRADIIVKNMNRFAHSSDKSLKRVDVNDTLGLVIALSHRFASLRSVTVTVDSELPETPMKTSTNPFLLMNLIWLCLDFAMDAAGEGKFVEIAAQKSEEGARICFRRLEGLTQASLDVFPTEREELLSDLLGIEIVLNTESKELVVTLGHDFDGRQAA